MTKANTPSGEQRISDQMRGQSPGSVRVAKNLLNLNRLRSSATVAALSLAGAFFLIGTSQAQLPPTQTASGIEYVTGGFGQEESSAFKQAQSRYALALTFAVSAPDSGSSPYAGNIQVQLSNAQGDTVLDATSTGPYFLANPEPGDYRLAVTYEGQMQTREVTITPDKAVSLKFTWKRPAFGPD